MTELNDLLPMTPDLNRERLAQLKALMPDLFTNDGRLNVDELKRIVDPELVVESERFEFRWFGKAAAKRAAFTPSTAALQYDAGRSVNADAADGNLIIEGENLEALKCLLSAYREKIKCIYIDPPYNTGNDFVYSDNYSETRKAYWEQTGTTEEGVKIDTNSESDGRYHSNWLNMIYPRLLVARQLLRDDGVIFISIDDNEVHHLRKVCDEVFGEENFVANFIWEKRTTRENRKVFSFNHDYVVCYAKERDLFQETRGMLPFSEEAIDRFSNPDNDPRGEWQSVAITAQAGHGTASQFYTIITPGGREIDPPSGNCWRFTKERLKQLISENRIWFGERGSNVPRQKLFLSESNNGLTPHTLWKSDEVGTTDSAKRSLNDLLDGESPFDTPKSIDLMKRIVQIAAQPSDIILDFFAGSGTTGQAVMELNKEDGGNRKCILVQLPELTDEKSEAYKAGYKKISDITIERNKRVIARIEQKQAEKVPELFDGEKAPYRPGFKVYRLVKSHFPRCEFVPDPELSTEENIARLKTYIVEKEATLYSLFNEADIFDEVLLKNGFMLNYSREVLDAFTENRVYRVRDGNKEALVCLDVELNEATIARLKGHSEIFICLERALDTTKKWNLKHQLGERLVAF